MVPRSARWEFLNSRLSTGHDTPRKKAYQLLESDIILSQFKRKIVNPTFNRTVIQTIRCLTFGFKHVCLLCYEKIEVSSNSGIQKMASFVAMMQPSFPSHRFFFGGGRFPWLKCLEIRCILGNLTKKHVVKK